MTTAQLIERLQKLDPEGTMDMLVYDGDNHRYLSMNHPSTIHIDEETEEPNWDKQDEPNSLSCGFN